MDSMFIEVELPCDGAVTSVMMADVIIIFRSSFLCDVVECLVLATHIV